MLNLPLNKQSIVTALLATITNSISLAIGRPANKWRHGLVLLRCITNPQINRNDQTHVFLSILLQRI
jgi:hypothetical protein